ncbi:hypothetical protein PUN28_001786 [Cardiocondyla obscurior]|uniref:Uncharacterized protein n=1 Tax=Cardiocondyla obscurior TaxID=286306 RepID=A0AAW2GR69_9HYME
MISRRKIVRIQAPISHHQYHRFTHRGYLKNCIIISYVHTLYPRARSLFLRQPRVSVMPRLVYHRRYRITVRLRRDIKDIFRLKGERRRLAVAYDGVSASPPIPYVLSQCSERILVALVRNVLRITLE